MPSKGRFTRVKRPFSFPMAAKRFHKMQIFALAAVFSSLTFCHAQASVFSAQSVVDLVNSDRIQQHIQPLKIDNELSEAAKEKAYDMFAHNYFAHNSPAGVTPWDWFEKNNYDYAYAGENLAINFTDAQSQQAALMASPAHRDNIVNPKYQDIGVAVVEGSMDGRQTILTVQEFGARAGAATASKSTPTVQSAESVAAAAPGENTNLDSRVGGTYTGAMLALSVLVFCSFVLLIARAHDVAHQFSARKRARNMFADLDGDNPSHAFRAFVDAIRFDKIYLTHMKMRK